jgi:dienelactone hydrolase
MAGLSHPDRITGALARLAQVLRPSPHDTLDRLGAYEGLAREVLFPAPPGTPEVRRSRRWRVPGMESEDLRFRSQHEPIEPKFRSYYAARRRRIHTATARRIRPAGAHGRPRLLYIHGYMQPETVVEELALLATMARSLQMEVVQLQPPYHGRRKPRASFFGGELYWTADIVRSFEALRQTILDARSLLTWLRAESPAPVGIAGLSLGGALTAALACLEPGFAFAAPLVAHMDVGALTADAPVLTAMRSDLAKFGWSPTDLSRFLERIGWDALRPVIPVPQIQLFAARDDLFFRPKLVTDMWERWGKPPIVWYPCSHMGFIAHLPDALRRLRSFADALEL